MNVRERKSVKVVFFDIGSTLIEFHEKRLNALIGDLIGATREEVSAALQYDIGRGKYHQLWVDLEKRLIDLPQFCQGIKKILKKGGVLNRDFSFDNFYEIFTDKRIFELYPFSIPLVRYLRKKGIVLGVISNINEAHWKILKKTYRELFDMFSIKTPSYLVGERKPEKKIWEDAVFDATSYLDISFFLSECVFVDDRIENVYSAINFGMRGIHFRGYVDPTRMLLSGLSRELGIDIDPGLFKN